MFPLSSQKKHWLFNDENDLALLREKANAKFIAKHGANMSDEKKEKHFPSVGEERILQRFYESQLKEFCKRFNPPMPKSTIATSLHYFKRFYLHNSVMDYHPKEILVTCVYLACKVEEFNVSISQFVANLMGDREKASDIILNNELLLMQQLNYNLTVHNPFRPVEGLLIDIKTRFPAIQNPERLRPHIDDFLEKVFLTDSVLLYAPSQIALAATLHGASSIGANLDNYVTEILFSPEHLIGIVESVKKIRLMAKSGESPSREVLKTLEKKLDKCRNQDNNPDSEIYKQRMLEMLDEEDFLDDEKYARLMRNQAEHDDKILGAKVLSPSA
ncbi:hypothetical protein QAD02_023036 [Eretmocerus hayati]|uniref:Uncharacterized protein n=1 Tax=Eretmocerus hayati TaxID=131215 RepID=A0ACC2PV19_9HYME|nr:hypothetical protein QAD02_023036 [Eretmocerus hayati]